MENSVESPQKIKNRINTWPSDLIFWISTRNFENMYSKRYMYPYIHYSNIHGGQDKETMEMSFDRWMD